MVRLLLTALLFISALSYGGEPELLEAGKAFRFAARLPDARSIEVTYQIAAGYYMYGDKFLFTAPDGVKLGKPQLPAGKKHIDQFFGEVETYRGKVNILLPIEYLSADTSVITLDAVSQGCADIGVCYPPQTQRVELRLVTEVGKSQVDVPNAWLNGVVAEDNRIALLFGSGFWILVVSFFGFGVLLSFTPCMLPMVPIVSGVIVGSGHSASRIRGFMLSVVFVLGMAITYAVAGVIAGLSGAMLSTILQNPWVVGAYAAVFVALALSMYGVYEFQLPTALQSRLAVASKRFPGGQVAGVLVLGMCSALIVGPCVAAPLAGALLYIGQSRDVALGGSALFAMALGMGVPLLAVGASAGALLPKPGPWMDTIKRFFGTLLMGTAIYLLSPFLAIPIQMLLWSVLLIVTAIFMRAIDPLSANARGFEKFTKGIGAIALIVGAAYLLGALSGSRDILQPLSGLRSGTAQGARSETPFVRVANLVELEERIRASAGRIIMLDFYAEWCVSCKEMERFTFSDARVKERFRDMVLLQADVTGNNAEDAALLKRFGLFGPPGIIFLDRQGREIPGLRLIGFQNADRFVAVLDQASSVR